MSDHSFQKWRAWIALAVFAAIVGTVLLVAMPEPAPKEQPAAPTAAQPIVAAPPPLSRSDLIAAVAIAADAAAAGTPLPPQQTALAGRQFVLMLPFGCPGVSDVLAGEDPDAAPTASWDEEREALRASFPSETLTEHPVLQAILGDAQYEAAEGFWIRRPWLRNSVCPAVPKPPLEPDAEPGNEVAAITEPEVKPKSASGEEADSAEEADDAALPQPTLGIVQLFDPGSRRAARRNGEPYSMAANVPAGELQLDQGLRLRVEGRLAQFPGGHVTACSSLDPGRPPVCFINARFERIAITDAAGERVYAQWVR